MKTFLSKIKEKRLGSSIAVLVLLMIALGSGIYAWIFGSVTPGIEGSFKIKNVSSISFNISGSALSIVNLNNSFGIESENLMLNEVSSVNGESFIARDLKTYYVESGNPVENQEIITFKEAEKNEVVSSVVNGLTISEVTGDYFDASFTMQLNYQEGSQDSDYYVYFLSGQMTGTNSAIYKSGFSAAEGSAITDDGLSALRMYFAVSDVEVGPSFTTSTAVSGQNASGSAIHYILLGNNTEDGTSAHPYHTSAVAVTTSVGLKLNSVSTPKQVSIAGTYYIDYLTPTPAGFTGWPHSFGTLVNQDVMSFEDFSIDPSGNICNGSLYGTTLPNDDYLFKLSSGINSVEMTIRVWLEGGSEYCNNQQILPDSGVKLGLYFVIFEVPKTS